jgi:hypothetical protein
LNCYLFLFSSFEERIQDTNATYQSKVDDGTLNIRRSRQNMICVEQSEGMGQQLIEVTRADFNNDGIEDILLFEYCYATHGTMGFGGVRVLTIKSAGGLLESITDFLINCWI